MNQSYRLIWSGVRGAWAVASELAKSHAKSGSVMITVAAASAAMPAQARVISSDNGLTVTGKAGSVVANFDSGIGIAEFNAEGQTFTFSSEYSLLAAENKYVDYADGATKPHTIKENKDSLGGIYNITKNDKNQDSVAGVLANRGALIDLSTAKQINYTSNVNRPNSGLAAEAAIEAANAGTEIKLSNLNLTHTVTGNTLDKGDEATIYANTGGKIAINQLTLTTNVDGLVATGGSTITIGKTDTPWKPKPQSLNNQRSLISVTTGGKTARAVSLDGASTVELYDTNIEMTDALAQAFVVKDGSKATFQGGSINLRAAASTAFYIDNSTLRTDFVDVVAGASDSIGLHLVGSAKADLHLGSIFVGGTALSQESGTGDVFLDQMVMAGTNAIIAKPDSTLNVQTNNTSLIGAVHGSVNLNLSGDVVSSDIDSSTWYVTGDSDLLDLTVSRSDLRFVGADGVFDGAFKTLTVNNYFGDGGTDGASNVYLNTRLGGDDITGAASDKIVIRDGGTMNGDTTFHVKNVGGVGASTVDGILLVDAQGSAKIDTSKLKLAGGSVTAGAYAYVARQGQVSDLEGNSQDLFLTNYIPDGATVDTNGFIVDPVEDFTVNPATRPNSYSADFVTYNAVADVVALSANTLLGSYHERMGVHNVPLMQAEDASNFNANSWGRLIADTREVAYAEAALNQSVKGSTTGFQLGHTIWQNHNEDGTHSQAGLAVGYVQGSMDVSGDFIATKNGQTGTVDADTTSLTAYYTSVNDDGLYVDFAFQYSASQADAQGAQSSLALDSTGLRGSLEIGIPAHFESVTVESQGQIIGYKDAFDDTTDSKGYVMSQEDSSGMIVRFGARVTSNDTTANFKPWFAANVNFQNGTTGVGMADKKNNVKLSSDKDSLWADMSVGMSYQVNDGVNIYGHLKQSVALDGGTNTVTSGGIGIQKSW
jgi:autotransporter family porin